MIDTEADMLTPPRTPRRSPSRFEADTYFLETRDALERLSLDPDEFGWRTGLLLLKPDAAVTGGMCRSVTWLTEHGYRIVGAHAVVTTHLHARALWYFDWHRASPERRRLADQLGRMCPSVVLLVGHPDDNVAVSARLTEDKGPANPTQRVPGQLRYALDSGTYLLNQVHTPDDPDGVLRELSIYFPEPELSAVITACAATPDVSAEALQLAGEIESGVERRSGDVQVAHDMVWEQLRSNEVVAATERPQTGPEWLAAIDLAERHDVPVDPWYRIVLESAYLPMIRHQERSEK